MCVYIYYSSTVKFIIYLSILWECPDQSPHPHAPQVQLPRARCCQRRRQQRRRSGMIRQKKGRFFCGFYPLVNQHFKGI